MMKVKYPISSSRIPRHLISADAGLLKRDIDLIFKFIIVKLIVLRWIYLVCTSIYPDIPFSSTLIPSRTLGE